MYLLQYVTKLVFHVPLTTWNHFGNGTWNSIKAGKGVHCRCITRFVYVRGIQFGARHGNLLSYKKLLSWLLHAHSQRVFSGGRRQRLSILTPSSNPSLLHIKYPVTSGTQIWTSTRTRNADYLWPPFCFDIKKKPSNMHSFLISTSIISSSYASNVTSSSATSEVRMVII